MKIILHECDQYVPLLIEGVLPDALLEITDMSEGNIGGKGPRILILEIRAGEEYYVRELIKYFRDLRFVPIFDELIPGHTVELALN